MTIDQQIDATVAQLAAMAKRSVATNPNLFGTMTLSIDLKAGKADMATAKVSTTDGTAEIVETCKAPKIPQRR